MEHCRTGMVTLTISRDVYYINLQREGKEIELNGRMYDIKEVREQKDSVVVQAIEDVKEKDLVERVSSALKDDYGSKEKRTVLKIKTLKLFSEDLHVLIFGLDSHDVHYAPEPDRLVQSVYLQVSPPPPEVKII